jgi:predicted Zn-dependent protease
MSNLKDLLKTINVKADYIGIRQVTSNATLLHVRNAKPEHTVMAHDTGAMVEVLVNGQFGYSATNDLSASGLQRAAEKAHALATFSSRHPLCSFTTATRPVSKGEFFSPRKTGIDSFSFFEANRVLSKACEVMKSGADFVRDTTAAFQITSTKTHMVSSTGADITNDTLTSYYVLEANGEKNGVFQKRSTGARCAQQAGLEVLNEATFTETATNIKKDLADLLNANNCPEGKFDILLAPDQMILQLHESIGHPLELDRILGDERNYAGWSFVKESDFGKLQYGSQLLNVAFDPTIPGELASYSHDHNGCPATKQYLIQKGLLVRPLGALESQTRSGLPGVANARATDWNRVPIDRMANINMEPGTSKFPDMVKSIEKGVYMENNCSWSIDDFRNKFQFGCEYGRLIIDGELREVVRNPNYRGISVPFWHSLKMVGDKSTWQVLGTPGCGKGEPNQSVYVGHAVPTCLFSNIEVFGGGK